VVTELSARPRVSHGTAVGLFIALAGPVLSYLIGRWIFHDEPSGNRVATGLALHWLNFAAILAIVIVAERQPLASIGVRPLRWWTIPAGLIAGGVITFACGALVGVLGLSADTKYLAYLQSLSFGTRLLLVVTAGVFEETVYRGYALERLTAILGNKWLAGAVTVALFTVAHAPALGWAHLPPVLIVSIVVTLLYLWRRDLILNMIAHSTIDAIGLLVVPALS